MDNENERLIQLASLLKSDPTKYFDEFYELSYQRIYNIIYSLVKNHQTTEDLMQDTYIKFLNNASNLDTKMNPLGYLTTIARNTTLDFLRKKSKEVYFDAYDNVDVYGGEKDTYSSENDINVFEKAKEILKPHEFEIMFLHLQEDMTFDQISKHVDKPLGTVLWTYNNSLKKLRKGLKKYGL